MDELDPSKWTAATAVCTLISSAATIIYSRFFVFFCGFKQRTAVISANQESA